jgi:hypothetical protein
MRSLILAGFLFAGCGLSSGFNNPLFWDLLLVNSIPIAQNYAGQTCAIS